MKNIIEQLIQMYTELSTEVALDLKQWDEKAEKLAALHTAILALRSIEE